MRAGIGGWCREEHVLFMLLIRYWCQQPSSKTKTIAATLKLVQQGTGMIKQKTSLINNRFQQVGKTEVQEGPEMANRAKIEGSKGAHSNPVHPMYADHTNRHVSKTSA